MRLPEAWIISVGNELLNGRITNTNLTWLAKRLTVLGYLVRGAITVRDECDDISWAFRTALSRGASLILSTGGLGPTFDDKTSECLSKALGRDWVVNEEALKMVEDKYRKAGLPMTEHRVKMAKMPEGAEPIPNKVGTAPGILLREGEAIIVVMPGVPAEMKAIFEEVEPLLKERAPKLEMVSVDVIIKGVPESSLAPVIEKAMKSANVYIKSHPSGKEVEEPVIRLNVVASAPTREEAVKEVKKALKVVYELMPPGGRVEGEEW